MEKVDLCYLYDVVYSGNSSAILHEVSRDALSNSDIGYLCRYACEYYLHWGPEETIHKLSKPVLQMMKLGNLVEEMKLPLEISPPEKMVYLYSLMYPEYLGRFPKEFFVTAFYRSVFTGHRKEFPRCFFFRRVRGRAECQNLSDIRTPGVRRLPYQQGLYPFHVFQAGNPVLKGGETVLRHETAV